MNPKKSQNRTTKQEIVNLQHTEYVKAKYYPSDTKFGKDIIIASVTISMSAYILVIQIIQNGNRTYITDIYSFIWFLRNKGQILKKMGINS